MAGQTTLEASVSVASPRLWSTWDHGGAALYQADMELREGKDVILTPVDAVWNPARGTAAHRDTRPPFT